MQDTPAIAIVVIALGAVACVCALIFLVRTRRRKRMFAMHRQALSTQGSGAVTNRQTQENHAEGDEFVAYLSPKQSLAVSHAQHIGKRAQQQDAYSVVIDDTRVIAVVCDGMGGMEMGGEAAQLAVKTIMPVFDQPSESVEETMLSALNQANDCVYELCSGKGGATVVLAHFDADGLRYVAAGDSHIYVLRDKVMRQLGQDHIFYYDLLKHVRGGSISLQEANTHPEREHLTSFLGKEMLTRVNASDRPVALKGGDVLLLCSDGVYRALSEQEIAAMLEHGGAKDLVAAVLSRNSPRQDNITAVVIKVRENP